MSNYLPFFGSSYFRAIPHNSRLTAQAPLRRLRHGICVAKMLDNVGLRYSHRASGAKAPRTLRPLPLLRFAVSATGGAHLCSIQYYLRFWLGICRTSLAVSALRIMRYCLKVVPIVPGTTAPNSCRASCPRTKGEITMAKFHLIPIVLGAAIGVGVYVVSKYLAQDEESEQIVDDSAFDDSEASESTEDADETEENADEEQPAPIEEPAPVEEPAQEDNGVTIPIQNGGDVPNANPVQDKTEPVKLTEDGKVDPTTIAKAEDFGDWEEETGCRG